MIASIKKINTRKGDMMAFLTLEDLTGTVEVLVFPRPYESNKLIIKVDEAVLIKGKVSGNGEEVKVICEDISTIESHLGGEVHIKLESASSSLLDQVQMILSSFKGKSPVFFHLEKEKKVYQSGEEYWVDLSKPVVKKLVDLLGKTGVEVRRIIDDPDLMDNQQTVDERSPLRKKRKFRSLLEL
ncbi:MAG: DNA polymerase III subunit alpha [Pelotomaculum sp. PtaB.Bin013]|nr:MAG: DNA polymerase III subunit alpha [Pelotomaculum sp. PtaB.Bin013]